MTKVSVFAQFKELIKGKIGLVKTPTPSDISLYFIAKGLASRGQQLNNRQQLVQREAAVVSEQVAVLLDNKMMNLLFLAEYENSKLIVKAIEVSGLSKLEIVDSSSTIDIRLVSQGNFIIGAKSNHQTNLDAMTQAVVSYMGSKVEGQLNKSLSESEKRYFTQVVNKFFSNNIALTMALEKMEIELTKESLDGSLSKNSAKHKNNINSTKI